MKKGFTLVEIMIVVAIISIVIAIAIPGFVRARRVSQARSCQANLQRIYEAKEQWAMDNRASTNDTVTMEDLTEEGDGEMDDPYLRDEPSCPAGGDYTVGNIGTAPTCDSNEPGHYLAAADQPVSEWTGNDD